MTDILTQAKEEYKDAKEWMADSHKRFREDLKFSNPTDPQQWDAEAVTARKGRVTLTLDRTNQFISQIVNDARQNKPSIQVLPADSKADPEVAKRLNGIIRHIEYTSRAGIAYDMGIELSARVGLGWLRVIPKVLRAETNEQEITIARVHDPTSVILDPNAVEPDGSDSMWGFAECTYTKDAFKKKWKKAIPSNFDSEGWFSEEGVRVAEYFKVNETEEKRIAITGAEGTKHVMSEDEYGQLSAQLGMSPRVMDHFTATKRTVKWYTLSGSDILDETEFPSKWVPLIPVLGYELWIDGKRYLCGMVRRLMDSQRLHNYEMSALAESVRSQPKAPFLLPIRAIEGHEAEWAGLNTGNPAYLPYNDVDAEGGVETPIAPPIRLAPPAFPAAYANGATLAVSEMEASVGMYKSNLGQQSNAISGRAKLADQREGDTANFHYIDNLRRSMEHMGRIIVDMIPRIYDTRRQAKILGEDGEQTSIDINPDMSQAVQRQGQKIVAINPAVGAYDVRVKIGPSYTTMREETAQRLTELGQGNPPLAAALAPLIVKMADMPEADKVSRVAIALLPPPVQQVYTQDENTDIPPALQAQIQAKDQQMQEMAKAMDQAGNVIQDLQQQLQQKNDAEQAKLQVQKEQLSGVQKDIQAKAQEIQAAEAMLQKSEEIAKLQIQVETLQAMDQVKAAADQQQQAREQENAVEQAALETLRKAIQDGMNALAQSHAQSLEKQAQMLAEMHQQNMTALGSVAESVKAPRNIRIVKDKTGVNATSTLGKE